MLKQVHLIADIVTDLDLFVLHLEFLPAPILKYGLALFVSAFDFLAPFLMLFNGCKVDEFLAIVANNFDDFYKLMENMGAWPDS